MRSLYEDISLLTDSLSEGDFKTLADNAELEFASGSLRVLHTPGHTPGSCSFVREADRTLICGDCVLKRITPNPILSPDPIDPDKRFRSLAEYLVSLARLRELRPTLSYGGHGEPIRDFEEIFNRYVRAIDERQRRVISLIPSAGATAFEVAKRLFPDSFDHDVHRFLAISESVAHLDHAESEGKVGVEFREGVELYTR
jgi:glyoxylase-like metal-dependent hydrolase (beta-lactamase superfamily II)